jgi:tetratricopeptide (TPR) repeat protein
LEIRPQFNSDSDPKPGAGKNGDSAHRPQSPQKIDAAHSQNSSLGPLFWESTAGAMANDNADAETRARRAVIQGDALTARGQFNAALPCFHEAVWLCPDSVEYHYRLAVAGERAGQLNVLERHLHESVRLDPCFAYAHYALGRLYRAAGKIDRAIYHTAITITLAPRDPRYVAEYGILLMMTDQTQEAWELIKALITQTGPAHPLIAYLYARIAPTIGHEEEALAFVARAMDSNDLTSARDSRPLLQFAAASLLDSLGRYDGAFEVACTANESVRLTSRPHDPLAHSAWTTNQIEYFTPQRFDSLPRATHRDRRPVFIVGMPRSGTTLVEQILACHPDVCAAGELSTLGKLLQSTNVPGWPPDEPYPQCLNSLSTRSANDLAARYLSVIDSLCPGARYVTDKMPCNFLALERVELFLPDAHIIHCTRNPLDTCLSCYMTSFSAANEFKLDLDHLGAYYRDYRRLMDHWKKVLTVPILEMPYEDLVLDTPGQVRRLLEFLDLPWDDRCLSFHQNKRPVRTASEDQVRKPIYTSSMFRWKHYESHLGPLIASLGKSTVTSRGNESALDKRTTKGLASTQSAPP